MEVMKSTALISAEQTLIFCIYAKRQPSNPDVPNILQVRFT